MKTRKNHAVDLVSGALSGAVATIPMTLAMLAIRRFLPKWEQGPLEPHRITSTVLRKLHVTDGRTAESQTTATTLAHVGYGAASGALYAIFQRLIPVHPIVRGLCFGLGLCGASYAGWLPALGILPGPGKRPLGRNLLLVAAHAVWGAVLGYGHTRGSEAAAHAFGGDRKTPKKRASGNGRSTSSGGGSKRRTTAAGTRSQTKHRTPARTATRK